MGVGLPISSRYGLGELTPPHVCLLYTCTSLTIPSHHLMLTILMLLSLVYPLCASLYELKCIFFRKRGLSVSVYIWAPTSGILCDIPPNLLTPTATLILGTYLPAITVKVYTRAVRVKDHFAPTNATLSHVTSTNDVTKDVLRPMEPPTI
ncbi:hypothetical protein J6590_052534 [Homalodisca vitripennis]|nr:hypothetical protein J6590_052534 [Homalodisca vitripennis]